jgi:hypothetical protein
MAPDFKTLSLLLVLAMLLPATLVYAEGEEDEESLDEADEGDEGSEDKDEGDGTREDGPLISREDEDDVDSWSFEGEVEKKEEVKKEVKKKALPPEPKRYGNSGNWYEVSVECGGCETLLGQQLGIEDSLVMREFFDYVQVSSDRKSGKFVYPSEGETRPVGIRDSSKRVRLWSTHRTAAPGSPTPSLPSGTSTCGRTPACCTGASTKSRPGRRTPTWSPTMATRPTNASFPRPSCSATQI